MKLSFSLPSGFQMAVRHAVSNHFGKNSSHATYSTHLKTLFFLSLYLCSYCGLLWGAPLILSYALVGLFTALVGFNFSHDVMHGAYFSTPLWNRLWSYFFDINGTSSYVWKVTHNVQHHTYTNIHGHDGDIDKNPWLRFSPYGDFKPWHRWQCFYAPLLYAFTSLQWTFYSDYTWIWQRRAHIATGEKTLFLLGKGANLLIFLLFPLYFSASFLQVFFGFFVMHLVGGTVIALVFQLAHVVDNVCFPLADEQGRIATPWGEHEMATTSDFATHSHFWTFILGGLNFQIEHHLFPLVCHTHYPKIAPLVQKVAEEWKVPYHVYPTMSAAVRAHFIQLYQLGNPCISSSSS